MFADISHAEDRDFSMRLKEKELIKSEFIHDKVQYLYYKYIELPMYGSPDINKQLPIIRWRLRK